MSADHATDSQNAAMRRRIYDIGMHDGTDTEFYLRKGFDVVAVEANASLVEKAKDRFAQEIANGRLTIVNAAVSDQISDNTRFYVGTRDDISTLGEPANWVSDFSEHFVATTTIDQLMGRYGPAYYIKIDIEGYDTRALSRLIHSSERPRYVSFEANVDIIDECEVALGHLKQCGYTKFKLINQFGNQKVTLPYPAKEGLFVETSFSGHASGPFGEETTGRWENAAKTLARCRWAGWWRRMHDTQSLRGKLYSVYRKAIYRDKVGWYDIHATF